MTKAMSDTSSVGYCQLCGQSFPISYVIDNSDNLALMKLLPLMVEPEFMRQIETEPLPEIAFFNALEWNVLVCVNCAPSKIIWGTKTYLKHNNCKLFYLYSDNGIIHSLHHMQECRRDTTQLNCFIGPKQQVVPTLVRRSQL